MVRVRQAIVHFVRKGGCKSIKRIRKQLCYLDQDEDVVIELSERHGGAQMSRAEYEDWARLWAEQTGHYLNGESLYDGDQDLTTHIIVSFPPGTDHGAAYAAGRAWAEDVFGSGRNGGEWDYVTAFHTNRPHPHLHVIVNRRSLAARGEWLAISHRNRFLNYDTLRETLADAAWNHGIELDSTSREQRGLQGRGPTTAEYRRQARVEFRNHFEEHHEVVDLARDGQQEVFPELTGRRPAGDEGGGPSGGAGASRDDDRRQATGSTIPAESQREAENARDDRRSQERRRRAEDEVEAGPSRRREPQPSPFPEDNSDLYEMPPPLDPPDYDALAARQLRGEMAQADSSGDEDRTQATASPIPDDSRREAENARDDRRSQERRRRAEDEVEAGPSRRREPQPSPFPEDNSDLYEMPPRKREIGEAAAGPGRRRTPGGATEAMSSAPAHDHHEATGAGSEPGATTRAAVTDGDDSGEGLPDPHGKRPFAETIETRGQRIRRQSDERAARRERQRALEESEGQADSSETGSSLVDTTPSRSTPETPGRPDSGQTSSRQADHAAAGPDPSQPRAIPAVSTGDTVPANADRQATPEVRRAPSIERDRNRTR